MSLRILHCIHSVDPAGGGPIEVVKQLSVAHIRSGCVVEIVSLDRPDSPSVSNCPLTVHAMGPGWLSYGYTSRLTPWLTAKRGFFDVVVIHGLWQYHSMGSWRVLRNTAIPYVVFPHGMLDPWFKRKYPFKHLKKALYWRWGDYRVLRDASAVLFTCEEERRLASQSFASYRAKERVVKIGTRGPPTEYDHDCEQRFTEKWPAIRGKRCFLHLGRVHEKKGTDLLVSAFARFLQELPQEEAQHWHLIIGGPAESAFGQEMRTLVTTLGIESSITWTGMLHGGDKWAALRVSEVLCLPSHQENFGIVVAESLACGRPVLISDKVNIWREIDRGRAGFIEKDDGDGTFRLLMRWRALTPGERQNMGERAQACFKREFDMEKCTEDFISVVNEITSVPKS